VAGDRPSRVQVKLHPDGFDSLESDNVGYLELPALRSLWVYAPPSMQDYRHALNALGGIRLFPEEGGSATGTSYDLVVIDRAEELSLEGQTRLCVGLVPPDLQDLITIEQQGTEVVDWRRDSPLLQHVELKELVILDQPRPRQGVGAKDYENRGYEILAHGTQGPLLLEKREGESLSIYLLFHTDRSTLPYRVGFPILISNLVQLASHRAGLDEARANHTGSLPALALLPDRTYQIRGPGGLSREEKSNAQGTLSGVPAPLVGTYVITQSGAKELRIGASLLDASETTLAGVEEILFNEELSVAASAAPLRTDRALWPTFALLAFCVLLGEWWYFQRRPGGYAK